MNYYLSKYVKKYRVKAEIDKRTNDFCRNDNGDLENNLDIWIDCKGGVRIYHYGGSVLEIYVPSIGKGRNMINEIYAKHINPENVNVKVTEIERDSKTTSRTSYSIIDYDVFNKDLVSNNPIIFNYSENDSEIIFHIKDKNLGKIIDVCQPKTSGASISPFSSKNLPKKKVILSESQIEEYEKIIEVVPKDERLIIGRIQNRFFKDILTKKLKIDVKAEMKKTQLDIKNYIAYKGYWDNYLDYLRKELING